MSVQVENLEHNMAKLTIGVPAEEFEKALQRVYMKQKNSISIQGFRKGKVPRSVVEKMYGAGIFYEDAANQLLPDSYGKADWILYLCQPLTLYRWKREKSSFLLPRLR